MKCQQAGQKQQGSGNAHAEIQYRNNATYDALRLTKVVVVLATGDK